MKLQPDDVPRSSLSIELGFGQYSGISPKFARRFAEGIGKVAGNTPRDRRKTRHKNVGGCRISGMSDGCTTVAQVFGRLTVAEPLSAN
ncbi:hypothetical protein B296_00042613 [Ensete ventricosum]|uniref:Uncharacterized protein n=1 Tax=Ensete ventricosum TaxID=4639 RepID=A0A426XAJ6_ENSVE|nr:hypothetical protein B296_00042613 [Ensete ventricosum]